MDQYYSTSAQIEAESIGWCPGWMTGCAMRGDPIDVRAGATARAALKRYRRAHGDTRVKELGYLGLPRLGFGRAHSGSTPFRRQTQALGSCQSETSN